jgi:hypothetical protein
MYWIHRLAAILVALLGLFVGATGCSPREMPIGDQRSASRSLSVTPLSDAKMTEAPTSGQAVEPTPVIGAAVTHAATALPVLTSTSTPPTMLPPTLTADEEVELVSELMLPEDSCPLPCWWNIVPGKTTIEEAQASLFGIGAERWESDLDHTYFELKLGQKDGSGFLHPDQMSFRLYHEDGIVTALRVSSWRFAFPEQTLFDEQWESYGVTSILDNYGMPSEVHLLRSPNPAEALYELILTYNDRHFQINYLAPHQEFGAGNGGACFQVGDLGAVQVATFSSDAFLSDYSLTVRGEFAVPTWQEATGTSLEDFYEVIRNNREACVAR